MKIITNRVEHNIYLPAFEVKPDPRGQKLLKNTRLGSIVSMENIYRTIQDCWMIFLWINRLIQKHQQYHEKRHKLPLHRNQSSSQSRKEWTIGDSRKWSANRAAGKPCTVRSSHQNLPHPHQRQIESNRPPLASKIVEWPSWKLTWQWKTNHLKMHLLQKLVIFIAMLVFGRVVIKDILHLK